MNQDKLSTSLLNDAVYDFIHSSKDSSGLIDHNKKISSLQSSSTSSNNKVLYSSQRSNRKEKLHRDIERGNHLAANEIQLTTLNASDFISNLSNEMLCRYFSEQSNYQRLILQNWNDISLVVFRSISFSFGENLIEVDLSNSLVNSKHLEVLFLRANQIETIVLINCRNIESTAMQVIVKLCYNTLKDLYLSNCEQIKKEQLFYLSGSVGFSSQKLKYLKLIDLSETSLVDDGLLAIAMGCSRLEYINLNNCLDLTDKSLIMLAKQCKKLKLLYISNCPLLTDKTLLALGQYSSALTSINISKNLNISDEGIHSLVTGKKSKKIGMSDDVNDISLLGCKLLEAIVLVGCINITEHGIFKLAKHCSGVLMLNVDGCPEITSNGLDALVQGIPCVEKAISFLGFNPIDDYHIKKLEYERLKADKLERVLKETKEKNQIIQEQQRHQELCNKQDIAVLCITRYIRSYCCRIRFYQMWQIKQKKEYTLVLQRVSRGYLGRKKAKRQKQHLLHLKSQVKYVLLIQKIYRGHFTRRRQVFVSNALKKMYRERYNEVITMIIIHLQACCRRYLAKLRIATWKELQYRRYLNESDAILSLQSIARMFISKLILHDLKMKKQQRLLAETQAIIYLQRWIRKVNIKWKLKQEGLVLLELLRRESKAIICLQRVYRGHRARYHVHKMLITKAVYHKAAILIQKVYRSSKVMHWKDIRLNVIASFVLNRHAIDRHDAIVTSRLRYKQFIYDIKGDSSSDEDKEEGEIEWIKSYDMERKRDFWFNNVDNNILFQEPKVKLGHEKSLIGRRVRIYWIVQKQWYEGNITRFRASSHRHRVQYDDNDREWIDLSIEYERCQVQLDDGSWVMYLLYESEASKEAKRILDENKQREEYQRQAYSDARQWKIIQNDYSTNRIDGIDKMIMFISQRSGELRKGVPNAEDWVIQDDGYGYPCFYNIHTNVIEYEDPRFIHDINEDIESQRSFILQEIRFTLYFCIDFYERYSNSHHIGDNKQLEIILLNIYKSPKPKYLKSLLIRAQVLYQSVSIVDKIRDEDIKKELDYALTISLQMDELIIQTKDLIERKKELRRRVRDKYLKSKQLVE